MFSRSAEYSLRIAAFLSIIDTKVRFNSKEVASATNIPASYCSKILKKLVAGRILESICGKGGGFVLKKAPSKISFYDILAAIDNKLDSKRCVFGLKQCDSSRPCPLHYRWKSLNEKICAWATNTTLDDVINDLDRKRLLLPTYGNRPERSKGNHR